MWPSTPNLVPMSRWIMSNTHHKDVTSFIRYIMGSFCGEQGRLPKLVHGWPEGAREGDWAGFSLE